MNQTQENKNSQTAGTVEFVRLVSRYFMDFLETDFHKRKYPKRCVQAKNKDNMLVGINLNKYPEFLKVVRKEIVKEFQDTVKITPKTYTTNIPEGVFKAISLQAEQINKNDIENTLNKITAAVEKHSALNKEYDFLNAVLATESKSAIKQEIAVPFIKKIETTLLSQDSNNIFLAEEELAQILFFMIEDEISEIVRNISAGAPADTKQLLAGGFPLEEVRAAVLSFFKTLHAGDLYAEIAELAKNNKILDKQELYLYFFDITYSNVSFPVFYIPISVENGVLEFGSQVYINKRAMEFIVQEYNAVNKQGGSIEAVKERIMYLANYQGNFTGEINKIISEIAAFFKMDTVLDVNAPEKQNAKSLFVSMSNNCYITLFDKSDEALVNDYEEILDLLAKDDKVLTGAFGKLIDDFIYKEPVSVNSLLDNEWDQTAISDKLVCKTPIPLNAEQRLILNSLKKDECKYVIVEGPPGTGKSHTITAVVCDAILNNRSVLVLSDKKEALDVVEDKITESINKIRTSDDFQNPILRLGKTGSTYNKILNTNALESIKTHHKVVKGKFDEINLETENISKSLKDSICAEISAYKNISLPDIERYAQLEAFLEDKTADIYADEFCAGLAAIEDLCEIRNLMLSMKEDLYAGGSDFYEIIGFNAADSAGLEGFKKYVFLLKSFAAMIVKLEDVYGKDVACFSWFESFTDADFKVLIPVLEIYREEWTPVFGFFFKKKKVGELDREFRKQFSVPGDFKPHTKLKELSVFVEMIQFAKQRYGEITKENIGGFDFVRRLHKLITDAAAKEKLQAFLHVQEKAERLSALCAKYEIFAESFDFNGSLSAITDNPLAVLSPEIFDDFVEFLTLKNDILSKFDAVAESHYPEKKKQLEKNVTYNMTYALDERLIGFYENNRSTAKTLKEIIRTKQKFPKDVFIKLKEAFPCILAGIRDYAEYIPLQPEIFDLIIMDEASQVSIAQAFPALLRAKKILILGDRKQFSNVKTNQARTDTNKEYLNGIKSFFAEHVSKESEKLQRVDKFNIKTSILDFFGYISNYNAQLMKYFRGYKEIIAYSNKNFYNNSLQVMKIRAKNAADVLKFSVIDNPDAEVTADNSNKYEAQYIIKCLNAMKDEGCCESVGIITPHTNQQKLLSELVDKEINKEYFYDKLKLKIMTFDTCQGEERDIIFYSMVANDKYDKLWGIFIKDLADFDLDEDNKIKAQRLNVGFSRAKETMHFILSKAPEKYNGSIGEAIRYYQYVLAESEKEKATDTDSGSSMEKFVLECLYMTEFWENNKDKAEIFPQFELGKYLKQMDKTYSHPAYRVDFFLVYRAENKKEHKIIIEYDGFEEHFGHAAESANAQNYKSYYNESDIFRQKVLESYGYKFLRINKFNLGADPVASLNARLMSLFDKKPVAQASSDTISSTIGALNNGDMKECPKCRQIRPLPDFKDKNLLSGYGRFCRYCKEEQKPVHVSSPADYKQSPKITFSAAKKCPKCGSAMILKTGRFGPFYGCAKYPRCGGTLKK